MEGRGWVEGIGDGGWVENSVDGGWVEGTVVMEGGWRVQW